MPDRVPKIKRFILVKIEKLKKQCGENIALQAYPSIMKKIDTVHPRQNVMIANRKQQKMRCYYGSFDL